MTLDTEPTTPQFPLGRLLSTPGALRALARNGIAPTFLLSQHKAGKWGDLGPEDRKANDEAVRTGERILSAYELPDGTRVWVITEADRSVTTILLPEEY